MSLNQIDNLKGAVKSWFNENNLNCAIVGFSGGIDSALTSALCKLSGIKTVAVQTTLNNQSYSSNYELSKFSDIFDLDFKEYKFDLDNNLSYAGKEAALPIIRVSYFYALAAQLREDGLSPCVVGTANFDEASFLGFWGKSSDAAQDFYPISHLHKSEVYSLSKEIGIPGEIINATPSGDLQFSGSLNDLKMIGADYRTIEKISINANYENILFNLFKNSNDPQLLKSNILKNSFKYKLPFPGFHISNRLEEFRKNDYPKILNFSKKYGEKNA